MSIHICSQSASRPAAFVREAARRIETLGGRLGYDEERPECPVVRIAFNQENSVGDRDLALLTAFPELHHLVILSDRVTDAGLVHLEGLNHLRWLAIYSRSVTMAGVMKLVRELESLEGVSIRRAAISNEEKAAFQYALPWVKWR